MGFSPLRVLIRGTTCPAGRFSAASEDAPLPSPSGVNKWNLVIRPQHSIRIHIHPPHVRKGAASPPRRDRTLVLAALQNPESARLSAACDFSTDPGRLSFDRFLCLQPRLTQKTREPRRVAAPNPPPRRPHHPLNSQFQQRREGTMQRATRSPFAFSHAIHLFWLLHHCFS